MSALTLAIQGMGLTRSNSHTINTNSKCKAEEGWQK